MSTPSRLNCYLRCLESFHDFGVFYIVDFNGKPKKGDIYFRVAQLHAHGEVASAIVIVMESYL